MPPKDIANLDNEAHFEISQERVLPLPQNTNSTSLRSGIIHDTVPMTGQDVTIGFATPDPIMHFAGGSVFDDSTVKPGEIVDPIAAFNMGIKKTPYSFYEMISEDVLHRYLGRALQVNSLSHPDNGDGPDYADGYDPTFNPGPLFANGHDHKKLLDMILETGTKFVFDSVVFAVDNWDWDWFDWMKRTIVHDNLYLHSRDPEIICGATISEYIPRWHKRGDNDFVPCEYIKVPLPDQTVIDMFYPADRPRSSHGAVTAGYFDTRLMMMDYFYLNPDPTKITDNYQNQYNPDITQPETQLWYYHLATTFIDCGCESIHLNDLFVACRDDEGNRKLWYLVSKIREYAKKHARRKVILLDAHASNDPYGDNHDHFLYGWYYDPDSNILPNWKRQLIFDFVGLGIFYQRKITGAPCSPFPCSDTFSTAFTQSSELPVVLGYGRGLLNHTNGGLHPQGWLCSHSPAMARFDSGSVQKGAGCCYPPPNALTAGGCDTYGYDNTSWFARQREDVRQAILRYTYYKIKCLDPYNHLCMPGRLIVRAAKDILAVMYNCFTEKHTINRLWNGVNTGPKNWSPHNFTWENLGNPDPYVRPKSSLIFVGNDKIFFIGTDDYIHGYIYNNGTYNGGNWLSVSPTYAAVMIHGQAIGGQVKAKSDLVASPDGNTLLYIGVDGFIYGFKRTGNWDYEYFEFKKSDMSFQNLRAASSLIYPEDTKVYYIGNYVGLDPTLNNSLRVHGFIKSSSGGWNTVSPTYSAAGVFGQNLIIQKKAAGALTYVKQGPYDRIYYRDSDGYLSYYEVRNPVDYFWATSPVNSNLAAQQLKIAGNLAVHRNGSETRFYFVGRHTPSNTYYVHCLIYDGSAWNTVSPSYSADYYGGTPISSQRQSYKEGDIAVSPDGKTIVYFGFSRYLCCFQNIDGVTYKYQYLSAQIIAYTDWSVPGSSLQFKTNSDFFLITQNNQHVQHFNYGECYCINPAIYDYEK